MMSLRLIESAHDEAYEAINENRDVLDRLVLELLETETLNQAEIAKVFHDIVKLPQRPTWLSSQTRLPGERPPVLTPAELAAQQNGHGHLPPPTAPDPAVEEKIDEAASVGSHPLAEERPPVAVVEVPDDQPVNPDEKA